MIPCELLPGCYCLPVAARNGVYAHTLSHSSFGTQVEKERVQQKISSLKYFQQNASKLSGSLACLVIRFCLFVPRCFTVFSRPSLLACSPFFLDYLSPAPSLLFIFATRTTESALSEACSSDMSKQSVCAWSTWFSNRRLRLTMYITRFSPYIA